MCCDDWVVQERCNLYQQPGKLFVLMYDWFYWSELPNRYVYHVSPLYIVCVHRDKLKQSAAMRFRCTVICKTLKCGSLCEFTHGGDQCSRYPT
jgi:hypothetical protein